MEEKNQDNRPPVDGISDFEDDNDNDNEDDDDDDNNIQGKLIIEEDSLYVIWGDQRFKEYDGVLCLSSKIS